MRQTFINWEPVDKNNKPESGKKYMVADKIREDTVELKFAVWYNKGDVVRIPMKRDTTVTESCSAEEQLLIALFGPEKQYEVQKDGFYLLTSDYGVNETIENGAFTNCEKELVFIGNEDVFYAEEPLPPENHFLLRDKEKERLAEMHNALMALEEEQKESCIFHIGQLSPLKNLSKVWIGELNSMSNDTMKTIYSLSAGAGISLSTLKIGKYMEALYKAIQGIQKIVSQEGPIPEILERLESLANKPEDFQNYYESVVRLSEETGLALRFIAKLFIVAEHNNYYIYRAKFSKMYPNEPGRVVAKATAAKNFPQRMQRVMRLIELEAPDIILQNEMRMILESAIILFENAAPIHYLSRFNFIHNMTPDGALFVPTKEQILEEYGEDFDDDDEENSVDNDRTEEANVSENTVLPNNKYYIQYTPNYLMTKGNYVLYNPVTDMFYSDTETEEITVFQTWKECKDIQNKLNK